MIFKSICSAQSFSFGKMWCCDKNLELIWYTLRRMLLTFENRTFSDVSELAFLEMSGMTAPHYYLDIIQYIMARLLM